MLEAASKKFFHALAGSRSLKKFATRYGMQGRVGFARRFIAGEAIDEAIQAVRALESRGLFHTLDYLGESVTTREGAAQATSQYLHILDKVRAADIGRNISLKPTQLGLAIEPSICVENLRSIVSAANQHGFFVRVDMENSAYTSATLDTVETLWREGARNLGVVLQASLYRSEDDLRRVSALGMRVRLVKGAYDEPRSVAYQEKSDLDAAFIRMMRTLFDEGTYPAIATHDPAMIEATKAYASSRAMTKDRFEFQMLYGIRRDLQAALHADGYGMRVYVPFGREWFPYFMRRLGERPANVVFVIRGILSER